MIFVATEAEKKAMEEMGISIHMDRDEVIAILIREIIALKAPKTGQTQGNTSNKPVLSFDDIIWLAKKLYDNDIAIVK